MLNFLLHTYNLHYSLHSCLEALVNFRIDCEGICKLTTLKARLLCVCNVNHFLHWSVTTEHCS